MIIVINKNEIALLGLKYDQCHLLLIIFIFKEWRHFLMEIAFSLTVFRPFTEKMMRMHW